LKCPAAMAGKTERIILASTSPRRKELMEQAGYKFTVVAPRIDEKVLPTEGLNPQQCAEALALAKAKDVSKRFPRCLVIGADTVVDLQGRMVGKAADEKEAERIIKELFSTPHKVITALAIVRVADDIELVQSEVTTVYPRPMSSRQIADYVKSGQWRGKSGAYAIKEDGDEFVERIDGSLTNVMGLPVELLKRCLAKILG